MELLWILLIVALAIALLGGIGYRGRRVDGTNAGPVADGGRAGWGVGSGLVGLLVLVALVILLVSLLG